MVDGYYDNLAQGYDELHGEEQRKKMKIIRDNIVISPDSKILDIGCGTGISTDFECECIGIDPSEKLIEEAIKKDKDKKHKYIVGKAEELDRFGFKDKEFDYVLCVSAVHHFNDFDKCLKEINRISKKAVIMVYDCSSKYLLLYFHLTAFDRKH